MKGHELRSFEKNLLKKDEAKDFCKLIRFCDKEGNVIWTLPENQGKLREENRELKKMSIVEFREIKVQLESEKNEKKRIEKKFENKI